MRWYLLDSSRSASANNDDTTRWGRRHGWSETDFWDWFWAIYVWKLCRNFEDNYVILILQIYLYLRRHMGGACIHFDFQSEKPGCITSQDVSDPQAVKLVRFYDF